MFRTAVVIVVLVLVSGTGCDRQEPSTTQSPAPTPEADVNKNDYTTLRTKAVEQYAGSPITPIRSADEFVGAWEMRFGGPVGSDEIQWVYKFSRDGKVKVGDETWKWKLNQDGTLSLFVTVTPDPDTPGLENGATSEELRHPFKTKDGRIVLSNEDTSIIELLSQAK